MNKGRNPFEAWQELQTSMMKHIPMYFGQNGFEKNMHKAIKSVMQHAMAGQSGSPFSNEEVEYELFDSQRVIIVRCKMPENATDRDTRFFANKTKLKIECSGSAQEIRLPSDIYPTRSSARIDGDVVEILLPKVLESEPFHEIFIRE
ncbi:Hsp20/alpha crystallin family protein [Cohnella terricola]|uniref:Hsp20/alpha crystallin family protein n=1 Tax=Cohnella terricola TaxID=1289167 RepID=A0A559JQ89_9BACL|nr:Hsp20/alpha crystallin family protein [Cohnella terricola]TVY02052.1 hypothetical protein FPZ45_06315 [Cohnella terricola]